MKNKLERFRSNWKKIIKIETAFSGKLYTSNIEVFHMKKRGSNITKTFVLRAYKMTHTNLI